MKPKSVYFNPEASAVLDIIVKAGQPILHSEIVKQLAERGYDKKVAYKAISYCQQYKWIEHNLTTGYVLKEIRE